MKEMTNKKVELKEEIELQYQAPQLIEIGSFKEMTLGKKRKDTADETSYRY